MGSPPEFVQAGSPAPRFRPWVWFGLWLAAGVATAVLVGGDAGRDFMAVFGAGASVLGFFIWRLTRGPRRPKDQYVSDHRETLVFRLEPPLGMPSWYAAVLCITPLVYLIGEESWSVPLRRWKRTYAVQVPPGSYVIEIRDIEKQRSSVLEVALHLEGRLFVEYQQSWILFKRGRLRWLPAVPDWATVDETVHGIRVRSRAKK